MEREENNLLVTSPCGGDWDSNVPRNGGSERGRFSLTVDSSDNMTGTFNGARISGGTCNGHRITIMRTAGGNNFVYDGIITVISSTISRIKGTRSRLRSFVDEEGLEQPAASAEFVQEEWVAEKGGIFDLHKTEETQSE